MNLDINSLAQFDSQWDKFDYCTKAILNEMTVKKKQHLYPACYFLEYPIACYGIFTERLINARHSLKKETIDKEEDKFKLISV